MRRSLFQFVLLLTVFTFAVLIAVLSLVRPAQAQATDTPTPTSTATATPEAYLTINQILVSCWTMDEQSGTRADSVGSNSLTDNNTVGYVAGKFSNAASFVAANSEYLSKTSNASLQVGDSDASWSFWYYHLIPGVYMTVFGKRNEYWAVSGENSKIGFGSPSVRAETSMALEQWNYVIAWYDNAEGKSYIQVNGGTPGSISVDLITSNYDFEVGKIASGYYQTGYVDELAFWKKGLDEFERAWLYESGVGKSCNQIANPPTPTPAPTLTPTPGGERLVMLSSGDWVTVERKVDYGQIAVVGVIAIIAIIVLVSAILWLGEKWFN